MRVSISDLAVPPALRPIHEVPPVLEGEEHSDYPEDPSQEPIGYCPTCDEFMPLARVAARILTDRGGVVDAFRRYRCKRCDNLNVHASGFRQLASRLLLPFILAGLLFTGRGIHHAGVPRHYGAYHRPAVALVRGA
jgi:hypothetical protein